MNSLCGFLCSSRLYLSSWVKKGVVQQEHLEQGTFLDWHRASTMGRTIQKPLSYQSAAAGPLCRLSESTRFSLSAIGLGWEIERQDEWTPERRATKSYTLAT